MRNITVAVSDSTYRNARIWAANHDCSISSVVQYCIERLPTMPIAQKAAAAIIANKKRHLQEKESPQEAAAPPEN